MSILPGLFPTELVHLPLGRVAVDGERKRTPGGGGGKRHHASAEEHAEALSRDAEFIIEAVSQREPALGIEPHLVMVVEIASSQVGIDSEDEKNWARAGLRIVDNGQGKRVVAFSDDSELTLFLERLEKYGRGEEEGKKNPAYFSFFDSIMQIRPYDRTDRQGRLLENLFSNGLNEETHVVDLDLWHPGDPDRAASWMRALREALEAVGGEVLDSFSSDLSGVLVLRARVDTEVISQLLNVDIIARVELVAGALATNSSPSELSADSFAHLPSSPENAPLVGIIDSGVVSENPLLKGCIVESVSLDSEIPDGADRHGHGTAVASILLRGSIRGQLASKEWQVPPCRILSVRILDGNNELPSGRLPVTEISNAVRYLAAAGVRIINLSIGDPANVFDGGRAPNLAAVLDELARELNLVLVVPTGLVFPRDYLDDFDRDLSEDYASALIDGDSARLMDPAPAAIALTVGGIASTELALPVGHTPLGQAGWPSPMSRVGPGIDGAVKPELVASAGTVAQHPVLGLVERDELKVLVADGRPDATGVVTHDFGSSFAAPLVARAAAEVQGQYPESSANLIRALLLQGAEARKLDIPEPQGTTAGQRVVRNLKLRGYGEINPSRATWSSSHDVLMYCEEEIPIDGVHIYTVPIPSTFYEARSLTRGISVSLSYDPPVRARRIDYMASRMQFEVVRGLSAEKVLALFMEDGAVLTGGQAVKKSDIPGRNKVDLTPSVPIRSAGANQLGSRTWTRSLPYLEQYSSEFVVAVRNRNRWHAASVKQSYALVVRLWVDERLSPIYDDLRSTLSLRSQVRVRPQLS
ncbi:S8 family peptidase [Kitasatospora sp. NBC_00070]|uniref:S8 family peptidase n=1 Tax=Kitasatospora sp. NBC_00070 TaxID=2975962 RepID=UPI00324EA0E8